MKYWYDTEFLDDGATVDLASIGIVAEDGRTYYAQSSDFDTGAVVAGSWFDDNVLSKFSPKDSPDWKARETIAEDVYEFLTYDNNPALWAWFGAYDHLCLSQLYGRMIDVPAPIPQYTNDVRSLVHLLGVNKLPSQLASSSHNALSDAMHLAMVYDYIKEEYSGTRLDL